MSITTPITTLLKIKHPILLAGMGQTSGAPLAAAVCNAGGLGVIGGVGYTAQQLSDMINELKSLLVDKNAPFGVDLLIPQVGGSARATNVYPFSHLITPPSTELMDYIVRLHQRRPE